MSLHTGCTILISSEKRILIMFGDRGLGLLGAVKTNIDQIETAV